MNRKHCVICLVFFSVLFSPTLAKGQTSLPGPEALFQTFEAAVPLTEGLTVPEPLFLNHCNAQQTCPNQCPISCTGHVSCTVQTTSVTCDGVVTNCPALSCSPPIGCTNPCGYCACRAAGGKILPCFEEHC